MFLCALYFLKDFWCLEKENCKFEGSKVTKRIFTFTLSLLFSVEEKVKKEIGDDDGSLFLVFQ